MRLKNSSERNEVVVISGLVDAQISGNQSYPQTIKGLAEHWQVSLLTGIPLRASNIDYEFSKNHFVYQNRGGKFYEKFFALMKGKHKNNPNVRKNDALADYDGKAAALMTIFSFVLAIKLAIRYFSDARLRHIKYLYCYENIGSLAGIFINFINRDVKIVRRFQGTPIPLDSNNRLFTRFGSFMCSLKWSDSPIIMANDGTYGDLICSQLSKNAPVLFERNGLPDNILRFKRKRSQNTYSKINIAAVSKLKAWKRVDKVFKQCKIISDQNKECSITLNVVGDGPEYEGLLSMKKNFLSENLDIHLHGALPHDQAMDILCNADFLISNYDVSNLGNPVLEAAYLGIPILTRRERQIELLLGTDYPGYLDNLKNQKITKIMQGCSNFLSDNPPQIGPWKNRMLREIKFLETYGWRTSKKPCDA